jgi:predicted transcriptional regulator YheO
MEQVNAGESKSENSFDAGKMKDKKYETKATQRATLSAKVIRADGTEEDLGVICDNVDMIKLEDIEKFKQIMEDEGASEEDLSIIDKIIKKIKGG